MSAETESYKRQMDEAAAKILRTDLATFADAAKELTKRIVQRTPVGDPSLWKYPPHPNYVAGTLQASWSLTFDSTSSATIENKIPYGPRVEFGSWSTQAPNGMMRISNNEWPQIIIQVARSHQL